MENDLPNSVWAPLKRGSVGLILILSAFVLWSVFAKLSTTIHVTGELVSSSPSIQIQHPFGGTVNWVGVRPHQTVLAGEPLFRFDARVEKTALAELQEQQLLTEQETRIIEEILDEGEVPHLERTDQIYLRYSAEEHAVEAQIKNLQRRKKVQLARLSGSKSELEIVRKRSGLLTVMIKKQTILLGKKLTRESDVTSLEQRELQVAEQIARSEAVISVLKEELIQTDDEIDRIIAQRRADLFSRAQDNERKLSEFRMEKIRLQSVIEVSEVDAPVTGQIQALHFMTAGMFVPRGETLVEIAETLVAPELELMVPVTFIDQVHVGMVGRLTIPSLPQRELPVILIEILAISPEAEKDREGNPIGYPSRARVSNAEALELFNGVENSLRLSADMPINVALSGRQTTFFDYLLKPFLSAFSGALQD